MRYVPNPNVNDVTEEGERRTVAGLVNWGRFGNHSTDVIGYTYDADYHCPICAGLRFGLNDHGFVPVGMADSSMNEPWPVFGDDEWWQPTLDECQRLSCSDCHSEIDTVHYIDDDHVCTLEGDASAT